MDRRGDASQFRDRLSQAPPPPLGAEQRRHEGFISTRLTIGGPMLGWLVLATSDDCLQCSVICDRQHCRKPCDDPATSCGLTRLDIFAFSVLAALSAVSVVSRLWLVAGRQLSSFGG
jgi:hypothetical protein